MNQKLQLYKQYDRLAIKKIKLYTFGSLQSKNWIIILVLVVVKNWFSVKEPIYFVCSGQGILGLVHDAL